MKMSMSIAFSDKVIGMSPLLSGISLLLVCLVSVSYLLPSVLANQAPGKFPRRLLSPSWACLKLKLPIPAVQNKGTVLRSFKKRCSKNPLWWPARSVAINSYGVCKAILLHTCHTSKSSPSGILFILSKSTWLCQSRASSLWQWLGTTNRYSETQNNVYILRLFCLWADVSCLRRPLSQCTPICVSKARTEPVLVIFHVTAM